MTKIENHRADGKMGNFAIGYWLEGYLFGEPVIGNSILLAPIVRATNDDRWDWFQSSEIKAIRGNLIETRNSIWRITRARLSRYARNYKK